MAIIKDPSEVVSNSSVMQDIFSMVMQVDNFMYRKHQRKLQDEKYSSDAIDTAFDMYKQNPKDLSVINNTLERLQRIGKHVQAGPDSLVSQNFNTKMNVLKKEREEILDINAILVDFNSSKYDPESYMQMTPPKGWDVNKGPAPATKKIEEDIKLLENQMTHMEQMNRLDQTTAARFAKKIKDLNDLKGWVGYDGVLLGEDIKHFKAGAKLTDMYKLWLSMDTQSKNTIKNYDGEIQQIDMKELYPTAETYTDADKDRRKNLVLWRSEEVAKGEDIQKNLRKYAFDFTYVGDKNKYTDDDPFDEFGDDDGGKEFGHTLVFNDKRNPPVYEYLLGDGNTLRRKDISEREYTWLRETQGTDIWQGGKDYSALDVPDDWEPEGEYKYDDVAVDFKMGKGGKRLWLNAEGKIVPTPQDSTAREAIYRRRKEEAQTRRDKEPFLNPLNQRPTEKSKLNDRRFSQILAKVSGELIREKKLTSKERNKMPTWMKEKKLPDIIMEALEKDYPDYAEYFKTLY